MLQSQLTVFPKEAPVAQEERTFEHGRIDLHAWVDSLSRVTRSHRNHLDGLWDHAGRPEGRRCDETCGRHPRHCYRTDARPRHHRERLVGNTIVAAGRAARNWDMYLAIATTTTANSEEGTAMTPR